MKAKSGHFGNAIIMILPILMLVVLYVLEFDTGHIYHVEVEIGESELYTDDEIEEAASVLKCYFFLNMPGFEIREISYQEEEAYPQMLAMAETGEIGGMENVIVFRSVYVRLHGYDGVGENNTEQTRQWILTRDSEEGKWKVDTSIRP